MHGYGKRVLIAEDDEDTRNLCVTVLESAAYNVYVAVDGHHALQEMKKRRFDVVVTDHHMPKVNGFRLILLGRLVWPDTPIILMSGDDEGLAEMAEQGGAYGYLRKPFATGDFARMVEHAAQAALDRRVQTSAAVS